MELEDRVAIITGAGRGIGRSIAIAYAREGAQLALAARTRSELEETAQLAQELGAATCIIPTDITDPQQVEVLVQRTLDQFSTIDILVNNAGISRPGGLVQETDPSDWIQTIQVHLIGTYLCCRAVLPVMLSHARGKIINMAGAGASSPVSHASAYGTAKAAIVRLTETIALETAGNNVQANTMSPGWVHTRLVDEALKAVDARGDTQYGERIRQGLAGAAPEKVWTDLAVFLASDASGGLSGRLLRAPVDDLDSIKSRIPDIINSEAYTLRLVELT